MSLFRVYVDGTLFYHPQMSKLAITDARIEEDAENIDSMTLSAPFNHPYLSAVRPLASTIVCKKGDAVVFEGRALDNGTDFYNTHTWTCESCLDASAFSWHRNSGDAAADAEWDAAHVGTKTITVSTEDVTDNASFYCEVTI